MKKFIRHLILKCSLPAVTILSAQTNSPGAGPGPRHHGPGGPGGHPIIRAIDADKDGELSAAEIANASAAIRSLDANGDGTVSLDELRPARPAPPAGARNRPANAPTPPAAAPKRGDSDRPHPIDPVMLALDANGDGALSNAEISNAAVSLATLDANKDGKLTRDELRPLPPASN